MPTEASTRATLSAITPLFVVSDLRRSLTFYRDRLGFEVTHEEPAADPFFAIVARDGVQVMLKTVGARALPNRSRHPDARWDAYVHVPDPDALAVELRDRGMTPTATGTEDGLRGFEVTDDDGYVFFFGHPRR